MHSIDGAILLIDNDAGFVEATTNVMLDSMLLLRLVPEVRTDKSAGRPPGTWSPMAVPSKRLRCAASFGVGTG